MKRAARAFWLGSPYHGEIRDVELPAPGEDEVLVRTLFSGVSRGTETLVFRGAVAGNVLGRHGTACAQKRSSLHHVLQLAHVSGPRVGMEGRERT
jgi:NADPH:quinone reductase-like Zn-dependent oxidoreductase